MRPLGDITLEIEPLIEEMVDEHDLQMGEILALVKIWIEIHRPQAIEQYEDNTNPVFKYGHKDEI